MTGQAQVPLSHPQAPAAPCHHQGCTAALEDEWATAANLITALRTMGTLALWVVAVSTANELWLLAALLCYWIGDMADGLLARLTDRETRIGAVLDILADRLCVCLVVITYVTTHSSAAVPAAVFLLQFVVLDSYLSLAFTRWSLRSPNYFGLVDTTVYHLNWSPPAKVANTSVVVLVVLLTGSMTTATVLAVTVLAVKVLTAVRLHRLGIARTLSGCAVLEMHATGHQIQPAVR